MKKVFILSSFFFKDLIYRKIFFVAMGVGFCFILLSLLLGPLSYSETSRLAANFSIAGIQISLIFLSVLVGADFIRRDIEEQNIFAILSRPLSRADYYLSKFLAFVACLFVLTFIMWLTFFCISYMVDLDFKLTSLLPFLGIYIEALILFSFSLFLSIFSSSLLSVGASFSLFLVGHWVEVFKGLSEKASDPALKLLGWLMSRGLPNLESLNWKSHLTYQEWLSPELYAKFSFYGLLWVGVFIFSGYLVFSRKDFS